MLKNYIKVALRNVRNQKGFAFINIAGLAIGLGCCILALLFIRYELSYDRFHEQADSIFLVSATLRGDLEISNSQDPLAPAMIETVPEVVNGTRLWSTDAIVKQGNQVLRENTILFAEPSFFELFTVPFRYGDPQTALNQPGNVVLTAGMANKYFGDTNPVGQSLLLNLGNVFEAFTVAGVLEPWPSASSMEFNALIPFSHRYSLVAQETGSDWMNYSITTYLQLRDPTQVDAVTDKLTQATAPHLEDALSANEESESSLKTSDFASKLTALTDAHLYGPGGAGFVNQRDPMYLYLLGGIAVLILLIACFNFMNLSIGQASRRFREIGMRKAVGARRIQLVVQFWIEAVCLSVLALALGIMFAEILLPVFNTLADTSLALNYGSDWGFLLILLGVAVLTGILAGSYPALVLSSLSTVHIFKGTMKIGGRNALTRMLVVAQFCLSIGLIICTLVMNQQHRFIMDYNLGFDAEQVVILPTHTTSQQPTVGSETVAYFKQALAQEPSVRMVSGGSSAITRGSNATLFSNEDGTNSFLFHMRVDEDYLDLMDFELLDGRNFSTDFPSDATQSVLVNEAFIADLSERYELPENPVGFTLSKELPYIETPTIIGLIKDFHHEDLRTEVRPMMMHINDGIDYQFVLVKLAPHQTRAGLDRLETLWNAYRGDVPFEYDFLDAEVQKQYDAEMRWSQAIQYASILAIFIACMGLFGLTALTVSRRTKEIGIRKVLGSSASRIALLLSQEFITLVLIANLVAWPVAYLLMTKWLEDFAYQVDMGLGIFIVAGLVGLGIATLTVSYQAIKAAQANPVDALRYE